MERFPPPSTFAPPQTRLSQIKLNRPTGQNSKISFHPILHHKRPGTIWYRIQIWEGSHIGCITGRSHIIGSSCHKCIGKWRRFSCCAKACITRRAHDSIHQVVSATSMPIEQIQYIIVRSLQVDKHVSYITVSHIDGDTHVDNDSSHWQAANRKSCGSPIGWTIWNVNLAC